MTAGMEMEFFWVLGSLLHCCLRFKVEEGIVVRVGLEDGR